MEPAVEPAVEPAIEPTMEPVVRPADEPAVETGPADVPAAEAAAEPETGPAVLPAVEQAEAVVMEAAHEGGRAEPPPAVELRPAVVTEPLAGHAGEPPAAAAVDLESDDDCPSGPAASRPPAHVRDDRPEREAQRRARNVARQEAFEEHRRQLQVIAAQREFDPANLPTLLGLLRLLVESNVVAQQQLSMLQAQQDRMQQDTEALVLRLQRQHDEAMSLAARRHARDSQQLLSVITAQMGAQLSGVPLTPVPATPLPGHATPLPAGTGGAPPTPNKPKAAKRVRCMRCDACTAGLPAGARRLACSSWTTPLLTRDEKGRWRPAVPPPTKEDKPEDDNPPPDKEEVRSERSVEEESCGKKKKKKKDKKEKTKKRRLDDAPTDPGHNPLKEPREPPDSPPGAAAVQLGYF